MRNQDSFMNNGLAYSSIVLLIQEKYIYLKSELKSGPLGQAHTRQGV